MDEIVNLTQRMIQFEAALPPVRPDSRDLKRRHADYNATAMSTPPSPCKLGLAGIALYLGSGTLWNYLVGQCRGQSFTVRIPTPYLSLS